jgi:protein O-GlcNAc transferase
VSTHDAPTGLEQVAAALVAGDPATAHAALEALGAFAASDVHALYLRAAVLLASGEAKAGEAALLQARTVHARQVIASAGGDLARLASDAAYAFEVGRQFYNAKSMAAAAVAYAYAASRYSQDLAIAQQLQGEALHAEGRVDEAADAFAAALDLAPTPSRHSLYLYCLFFVADGVRRHGEEARRWARLWADDLAPVQPRFDVARRSDRPLRIGYLAPSFTTNQTRQFVRGLFEAHDPAAVELFLYVETPAKEDIPAHVHLRATRDVLSSDIAEEIRRDRIDVLVDVWGHAARNSLRVFARRPAPIQLSWLNYMQTTGLGTMDAVLLSDHMDAPGRAEAFREAVVNLGPVEAPFAPDPSARTSPAPALARGYVTFASFNHPAKLSPATLDAWARILTACPTARLKLKYAAFADPVVQAQMQTRFLARGVAPGRLEFEGHSRGEDYERSFAEIDLALDPNPCPGGTTTVEAFSRGVPVLTLRGPDFYSRIGVQPLMALGLPELVAEDWDDYVARAVALARDIPGLARLRREIRPRFDASPYQDAPAFARRLEATYRDLFRQWMAGQFGCVDVAA